MFISSDIKLLCNWCLVFVYKIVFDFLHIVFNTSKWPFKEYLQFFFQKKIEHIKYDFLYNIRGGSGTAATSRMELFEIIVNGWKPITIINKCSILNVTVVLNPSLKRSFCITQYIKNILWLHTYTVFYYCYLFWFTLLNSCMSLSNTLDFSAFSLDLFCCTISQAKEWVRSFMYLFIIETTTFFKLWM